MPAVGLGRGLAMCVVLVAGCTFTGLDDYSTPACKPGVANLDQDDCGSIATGSECEVYHCDASTARCVLGPRDWDRDGYVASECGGDDCDDHEPRRHPKNPEKCDGLDNDCNGMVDEGKLARLSPAKSLRRFEAIGQFTEPSVTNAAGVYASYLVPEVALGNICVQVTADVDAVADANTCSFAGGELGLSSAPRQPYAQSIGRSVGVTFVATAPCAAVAFRNAAGGALSLGCGVPGRNPSFATYATEGTALLAFFEGPLEFSGGTPIQARWIANAATALPTVEDQAVLGVQPFSAGPVALVPIPGERWILAASPARNDADGNDVALWALGVPTSSDPVHKVVRLGTFPRFANARWVALAAGNAGARANLALVAAFNGLQGDSLGMTLLHFDPKLPAVEIVSDHATLVQGDTQSAVNAPAVAWVDAGTFQEWRVTWLQADTARAARLTAEGTLIGELLEVTASGALAAAPTGSGTFAVLRFATAAAGGVVEDVALGCAE